MALKVRLLRERGFTLIEIAIVLVVVGLLLSGGLLAVAPVLENQQISDTEENLDRIEDALVLYVIQNGCLPCPADGSLNVTASANEGLAEGPAATFYTTGCAASCRADSGVNVVPWRTLGLTEDDIVDAWGNRIFYGVSSGLVSTSSMQRTTDTFPSGSLTVGDTADSTPYDNITSNAAYVVFSFGPDGSDARAARTGSAQTDRFSSTPQDDNADGTADFVQDLPVDTEDANHFDDITRWKSAELIVLECGSGSCGNP